VLSAVIEVGDTLLIEGAGEVASCK
jgi:hypothetical protein